MKVVVYSVPTINGYIAMEDESDYSFISDNSWSDYLKALKKAGAFVMGRRTFEKSLKSSAFPYDCFNVVMTKGEIENKWGSNVHFTSFDPEKVIAMLKKRGFDNVIITGGHLSTSFLKSGLVDEIWLKLMPTIFTKGINLFEGQMEKQVLSLLECKKNGDEVFLRYKVVKQPLNLIRHSSN